MKRILFLMSFLLSINCFGAGVGTKRTIAGKETDDHGNRTTFATELEVTKIRNDEYQVRETKRVYNSDGDMIDSRIRFNWVKNPIPDGQLFNAKVIEQNCALYYSNGSVETVTVPAGTFKTCKVVDTSGSGSRDTVWLGPVPFEEVKSKSVGPQATMEFDLKTYTE